MTITGNFTNGVTIAPIPAKFQTSIGSLETDGVVIDPPPVGCERPHHCEDAQPEHRRPRGDRYVHRDGLKRRELAVERPGDRDRDAAGGPDVTALSGAGWTCTVATTCTRSDALAPGASYPPITVTTSVGAGAAPGTVTNSAVVSGGGDSNSTNNTAQTRRLSPLRLRGGPDHHKEAQPVDCRARTDVLVLHYRVERGELAVERPGDRDRDAAGGPDGDGALWRRLELHCRDTDLHSKRRARPGVELPGDHGETSVGASVTPGTVTNIAVVSGGGETNNANNTATDPTIITSPIRASTSRLRRGTAASPFPGRPSRTP